MVRMGVCVGCGCGCGRGEGRELGRIKRGIMAGGSFLHICSDSANRELI